MNPKQIVGERAVEYIKDGMIIGLGTGSTAYWTTVKIGELVQKGLKIKCVPTSEKTKNLAMDYQIPLIDLTEVKTIDITIDGADEVDLNKNLIKGGGGALLREKLIASISDYYIIIADASKRVEILGDFPLPVEVTRFAYTITERQLIEQGCTTKLRMLKGKPYITDNGNYIYDCSFGRTITQPKILCNKINMIPGVVENGLFVNMANIVICSNEEGEIDVF